MVVNVQRGLSKRGAGGRASSVVEIGVDQGISSLVEAGDLRLVQSWISSRPEHGHALVSRIRAAAATQARSLFAREGRVVIHCIGREFLTRISMAKIFLRQSEEVIARDGSELVPLLHEGGIELLTVSRLMPIFVTDIGG
ncbi:hypothetical protein [Lacisediminihabitans profunda]|uniref:Uncharacterized protein n=1 Tax=Lacisediminihabitans profunda TaxID=2594790 RepID=A0A5C8UUI4_9MICO|nr:hypothetical protein [Lacisediminihabitans profunda]TXN32294.1 hypothetical protein FVP33_01300 [Lacisediminihabitans profunda]